VIKRNEAPSDLTVQRERRTRALWRTFLDLMLAEGFDPRSHGFYEVTAPGARRNIMRRWMGGKLRHRAGRLFGSAIEAADLGLADLYEAVRRGDATDQPPGSPGKIACLAERLEEGVDLWHPDDWAEEDRR